MLMEDQNQSNHHNTQFGIDLRQFITRTPTPPNSSNFPPLNIPPPQPPELFPGHRNLHHYDLMMFMPPSGLHLHDFPSTTTTNNITPSVCCINTSTINNAASSSSCLPTSHSTTINVTGGLEGDGGCFNVGGSDIGGTVRWPRQETLTLLEIRSRLDSRFKEANQKGPLWDEVSRIMSEEHGYQRSGKKCREKFENLYKYYKKTKEGKAGRQDGKHYRFFRQLEALYGETSNPISTQETQFVGNPRGQISTSNQANQLVTDHNFNTQKLVCDSLSLSNSSEFETSSSEEINDVSNATLGENDSSEKRRKRKSWKTKVKEFLDTQLRKLMERQEAWLERLTRTLEEKEQERLVREEEWRKKEAERVDKEHEFWAKEREWIEARDAALMEALQKITGKEVVQNQSEPNQDEDGSGGGMLLNNNNKNNNNNNDDAREVVKDGYNKKRKENSRSCSYFQSNESLYHPRGGGGYVGGASPSNSNVGNPVSDSCFRFLMSGSEGGEHLWENYNELNLKLNKEDHENQ